MAMEAETEVREPAAVHDHKWIVRATREHEVFQVFGPKPPATLVLLRCETCGDLETRTLLGRWDLRDLAG